MGSLHVFAISLEKHMDEVTLFPTDKQESFLQDASIILGVYKQVYPTYPE